MSRFVIGALTILLSATALAAQEPPRADGWVVLSLDEYRALRARAFPTPADPSPPPVDATLGSERPDSLMPTGLPASPGQIVGRVTDTAGGVVPGVSVIAEASGRRQSVTTDANGVFVLISVPSGPVNVTAQIAGFRSVRRSLVFDQRPRQADFTLEPSALTETVTVTAEAPFIDRRTSERSMTASGSGFGTAPGTAGGIQSPSQASRGQTSQTPSMNVQNLQRKAAGVLPVRIDVPRAGTSHRFVRALVIDEDTVVSFRYRRPR